jgi:hypothetical protein
MEASTGIEPVYTDLQALCGSFEINDLSRKKYQDITGTRGENDTPQNSRNSRAPPMKKPGAKAPGSYSSPDCRPA